MGMLSARISAALTRLSLAITLAVIFAGCGCDDVLCGVCGPAVLVSANDATTSNRIDDATCEVVDDGSSCDSIREPGAYRVRIAAPGFEPRELDVEVLATDGDGCCDCGVQTTNVGASLTPN